MFTYDVKDSIDKFIEAKKIDLEYANICVKKIMEVFHNECIARGIRNETITRLCHDMEDVLNFIPANENQVYQSFSKQMDNKLKLLSIADSKNIRQLYQSIKALLLPDNYQNQIINNINNSDITNKITSIIKNYKLFADPRDVENFTTFFLELYSKFLTEYYEQVSVTRYKNKTARDEIENSYKKYYQAEEDNKIIYEPVGDGNYQLQNGNKIIFVAGNDYPKGLTQTNIDDIKSTDNFDIKNKKVV